MGCAKDSKRLAGSGRPQVLQAEVGLRSCRLTSASGPTWVMAAYEGLLPVAYDVSISCWCWRALAAASFKIL